MVKKGDVIVVWFSCGAASAVAAKETIRKYGDIATIRIVNNPVTDEDSDNRRFLKDVEKWLGYTIESCTNPKYPDASCEKVWEDRQWMSGPQGAPCTLELKKKARQHWESNNKHDWLVLGFTSEEEHRYKRFKMFERENILPVLIEEGLNKGDCFKVIMNAGIALPEIYLRGYPNANCIGCVKSASPTYWNHVRVQDPEVFSRRSEQSRRIGAKLVKVHPKKLDFFEKVEGGWLNKKTGDFEKNNPVRIFLDELPEDLLGRPMKNLDFECGIFCEETE